LTRDGANWSFTPSFSLSPQDGLPADAWTAFLGEREGAVATREDARPFTGHEQSRIVRVGACLSCHPGADPIYKAFSSSLSKMKPSCGEAPNLTPVIEEETP